MASMTSDDLDAYETFFKHFSALWSVLLRHRISKEDLKEQEDEESLDKTMVPLWYDEPP